MKTIVALAAFATIAAPALANAPHSGSWKIGNDGYHIYYADLDVHSAAGRAQLLTRVETYAARLCNEAVRVDEQSCVAAMVRQLPNPDIRLALSERSTVQLAAR